MAARRARPASPPEELARLTAKVEREGLAKGYVFRGDEAYFRDAAVALVRARAQALGYEVCVHDAERGNPDFTLSTLLDDLSGGGLFAARRLVVVRSPEDLLRKDGSEDSALTRAVRAFVDPSSDAGAVVLAGASLRADLAAVKAVASAGGDVLAFRKLWDSPPPWKPDPRQTELVLWLVQRARALGVTLSPTEAVYVCAATGNDLHALEDQVEKLRHSGGRGLRAAVGWDAATTPWAVAEDIAAGDAARALSGIETLFSGGFQEKSGRRLLDGTALAAMLVSSLSRSARQSLAVARALARGASEAEAARDAGLAGPPAAVQGGLARARQRTPDEWRVFVEAVADLDRRAKSSAGVDANDFALIALRWRRGRSARGRVPARQ